ncbi:hypothetical protein HAX54_013535 [Datura stramonium]|uniref:Leucine-rich repeat-containing N-terminal plant-type domain-containing protein n=1 Tax=Datura stramonium TaxID=4076 RepID=A0ABS8RYZ5_DATST|nr:hypothetical protein [Datura stramonium]
MNYHPFILLFLVSVTNLEVGFSKTHHSNVTCSENDQKALTEFKNGLIDDSNRLSSWTGQNCCKWDGVFCDEKTGNVVKLDLSYKNYFLDGEIPQRVLDNHMKNFLGGIQIPPFFGLLKTLRFLNLSCAGFGGYIPHNLGNLSRLEHLYLGGCYGSVIGPGNDFKVDSFSWISKLSSLKSIDLSELAIEDTKDLWSSINMLPSLLSLNLEGCNLNTLPSFALVNFTSLSSLNIRDNGIGMNSENSSIVPPWFSNLTSLMNLDLGQNNFNGPTNIFEELSSLRVLDVSSNGFGDSLLSSLSKLNNLVYLDLLGNDIHLSNLHFLRNLTSLSVLKLRYNELKGPILEALTSIFCRLSVLDLSDNEITGLLPKFIRDPSSCLENRLKELYIGNTKFSDFFPEGMSMHKNLEVIDSTNSLLYGEIPSSIGRLSNLRFLRIANNKLNGSIPLSIGQLSNLEELDISRNLFTGIVSELHFAELSKLKKLHISKNLVLNVSSNWYPPFQLKEIGMASVKVGPNFPQWLHKQSILDTLVMSDANITDMIPNWLSNVTLFMTTLDLSANKLVGGINVLCDAQLLNSIDLSKNLLSGRIPSCLSNLEELRSLNLADNSLEGDIPSSLGDLSLRFLHLQKNNLQGKIPLSLQNLTSLQRLDLGENKLKDVFPAWIGEKLQSLELLRLNSNQLYGVIPSELCQISSLCWLNLAGNNLYGTIPRCFGDFSCMSSGTMYAPGEVFGQRVESFMKGIPLEYVGEQILLLRILDLSENKLAGRIPEELTKLVDLQYLNLSRNNLNGSIPKKLGDLKQLESLDLSHNKLSGSIPQSLASLNYLSYMNLSYNDFSGPIPTGNQLQSLDDQSFYVGNPRLCGKLIKKSCNGNEQTPQDDHQDHDEEHNSYELWFYAGIGPGFCVGFLGVLFTLYKSRNRCVMRAFQCLTRCI